MGIVIILNINSFADNKPEATSGVVDRYEQSYT